MKFVLAAIIFFVSTAFATPNPEPWCFRVSQGCWKVRRTIDTFVDAVKKSDLPISSASPNGIPKVELGDLVSFNNLASFLAFASGDHDSVFKALHASTPESDAKQNEKRWCFHVGQGCWGVKREVQEESLEKRWCFHVGQGCWKAKRDVGEIDDGLTAEKRWCNRVPEKACNAVKEVTRSILDTVGEEDEAEELAKREAAAWCYQAGQPCLKAKRDLVSIREAAKNILANLE